MTNSLKKCIAICACVKIDLAFQYDLTRNCTTNIGCIYILLVDQLMDAPFQLTNGLFGLVV
jgi:hypothetical protein